MQAIATPTPAKRPLPRWLSYLFHEAEGQQNAVIMYLILLNALVLFLHSFAGTKPYHLLFEWVDHLITIFFFFELCVKLYHYGWQGYFVGAWHRFDAALVLLSMPSLLLILIDPVHFPDLEFVLVLRVARLFKFYRLVEFIPNFDATLLAMQRALRASLFLIAAFFIYNFAVSLVSYHLFKDVSPDFFPNGVISFYNIFKAFTGEGFDIPEAIAAKVDPATGAFVRFYFLAVMVSGGIIGLSLVNAVFINEVTRDTQSQLDEHIRCMRQDLDEIKQQLRKPVE